MSTQNCSMSILESPSRLWEANFLIVFEINKKVDSGNRMSEYLLL